MTRLAAALLAGLACAQPAAAADFFALSSSAEAGWIEGDPWLSRDSFIPEDAFVFAEVTQSLALAAEAVAVAVQSDMDRLSQPPAEPARSPAGSAARVAAAFERFMPVGADGRAYASLEVARGRSGPATLTREVRLQPAVLAMSLPHR